MLLQDPVHVINKYGADALRLYLINSPVVRAESLRFEEVSVLPERLLIVALVSSQQSVTCFTACLGCSTLQRMTSCAHCAGGGVCNREGCVPALVQCLPLPGPECAALGADHRQDIPALAGMYTVPCRGYTL
jgi:hypothetical protein